MLVRALAFDVFGTLVDWRTAISSAFEESGVPGDPDELADQWRAQLWPATAEINEARGRGATSTSCTWRRWMRYSRTGA
jgi:hypothetical protein